MSVPNGTDDTGADPQEVDAVAQELAKYPLTNPDAFSYTRPDGTQATPGVDESSTPVNLDGTPLTPSEAKAYQKVATGSAASTSSSSRGVTDEGIDRVNRKIAAPKDRAVSGEIATLDANRQQDEAALDRDTAAAQDNILEQGAIQKEHEDAISGLLKQHADMIDSWAEMDKRFQAESAAQQAQYLHTYETQLAAARQIQVHSPYGGLSGLQAAGMSGAAFAQGFLAARYGIHIDVMGQIDKWVDQSIQEQERNKQNALDSANDQLNLWKISKETSNSEWEARQRYRGLIIQGMQVATQQEAARFGGDLAASQARAASIRLQQGLDDTKRAMGEQFYKDVHQVKQDALDNAYKMGTLAIQQRAQSLAEKRQAALDAANQAPPPDQSMAISDPEYATGPDGKPVTGPDGSPVLRNFVKIDPNLPKEEQLRLKKEGDEKRENYADYLDKTNAMMAAYEKAKKIRDEAGPMAKSLGWDGLARLDESGAVEQFLEARKSWALAKVYNDSGKQVNNEEFKRQENLAYLDKYLAHNGDKGEQSLARLRTEGRKAFERHFEAGGYLKVSNQDPTAYKSGVKTGPVGSAEDQAVLNHQEPVHGVVDTELSEVGAKDSEEVATKKISGTWRDFQVGNEGTSDSDEPLGQPAAAVALDHIAAAYVDPERVLKVLGTQPGITKQDEDPQQVRQDAYKAILSVSQGTAPGSLTPEAQAYAHHLYMMMPEPSEFETDPEGAKAKLDQLRKRLTWRP